jgi:7,8-dihydropterin-6-yl-methyl-4-(beta-D-ribofuranosyl)aminobenzene 5'-phosphate synthase
MEAEMDGLVLKISFLAVFLLLVSSTSEADGQADPPSLKLTVVFNNEPYQENLTTSWGFACLIEGLEKTILFDTGGQGDILLSNMKALKLDPGIVDLVALSHFHGDHTDGLNRFLQSNPEVTVCMPESFPDSFQLFVKSSGAKVKTVNSPLMLCEGVHSTGEMGTSIIEQSLVLETSRGLAVITGCAHPGIVDIVRQAEKLLNKRVYLVLGGFHLNRETAEEINGIIQDLKDLGVQKTGATHCTGDEAIALFRRAWGDDYLESGCGAVIRIPR